MKIGLMADERDDEFCHSYEHLPHECVLYETELPPEVKRGLEMISESMPSRTLNIPIANQSKQGHGNDYGLVFRVGKEESIELIPEETSGKFTKGVVVARISMGMQEKKYKIGTREIIIKDPLELARLHLNVYGSRNFLPLEHEESKNSNQRFNYHSEQIHFSLRWINGQFDNSWNDTSKWFAQKNSQLMNRPQFNSMRTTYLESTNREEHLNGNFYKTLSEQVPYEIVERIKKGRKILTLKEIENLIGPRKTKLIPANLLIEELLKVFPDGTDEIDARKSAGYQFNRRENFPVIGYSPACNLLSKFGDISPKDCESIPQMNMSDGVEYIFGKVLPAVKKFIKE